MGGEDTEQVMDHFNVDCDVYEQGSDSDIVHVVLSSFPAPFLVPWLQNSVHESLEGGGRVAHAKEHYFWFK